MQSFQWAYLASGLGIREDEFSWQGGLEDDELVFFRRCKTEPSHFTDLNLGRCSVDVIAPLFVEFLRASGVPLGDTLRMSKLAPLHGLSVQTENSISRKCQVVALAMDTLNLDITTSERLEVGDSLDVLFHLKPAQRQ